MMTFANARYRTYVRMLVLSASMFWVAYASAVAVGFLLTGLIDAHMMEPETVPIALWIACVPLLYVLALYLRAMHDLTRQLQAPWKAHRSTSFEDTAET